VYNVYYAICAIGWIVGGLLFYWLCRGISQFRRERGRERWAILLLVALVVAVIVTNYALSYPLLLGRLYGTPLGPLLDLYVPAEWLFDHSPLREPMLVLGRWAGSESQLIENAHFRRRNNYWGTSSPINVVIGWSAIAFLAIVSGCAIYDRLERRANRRRDAIERNSNASV
jgi:hypothetical protein